MALVLIGLIVGAFYLTAAIIYLLIEIGLAVERLSKKSRAKAHMRQLSTQLGSGTLASTMGTPIPVMGDIGTCSRWDSDTEGDTVSTTSTNDGGTMSRQHSRFQHRLYENFQSGDPGYHHRDTFQVQVRNSGTPPVDNIPPVPKVDEPPYDDAESSGVGSMGSTEHIPSDGDGPEQDLPPPPAHDEVSLQDECDDFYFEE
ncbi:hypothetical protein BVTX09c5_113 [Bovine papular stomatitis virus]|uniref:Uncharacterized protein n=1 Tax=Bovine papular stomatitis virus TaxID=129727 RepID=A0A0E3T8S8_9POXV|nr:hypothetical protein BVTX09c15_113 [Bovine papular stomatitis virus]AKC03411.1 hypothetical protein BVTX09c5_113 [Bovine papular stomatitis virus]